MANTFFRGSYVLINEKKQRSHVEIENGFIKQNIFYKKLDLICMKNALNLLKNRTPTHGSKPMENYSLTSADYGHIPLMMCSVVQVCVF